MNNYDFVVVGGGTAGCVISARLSENKDLRVLLLEAGSEAGPESMRVPAMWPMLFGTDVDWGLQTVPQRGLGDVALNYPRGKVLGGSSSINAMAHLLGDPSSYDNWAADGARGWGFADLLPYFRRSENVEGGDPRFRGTDGPITINTTLERHPVAAAFMDACKELDYPVSDDLNGSQPEGVCWYDRNIVGGTRQSAADAYLRPVLGRSNLAVVTGALVSGLEVNDGRCTAVTYRQGNAEPITVHAECEVILCAGAVASPHLLMLAGIGPAAHLRQHGIDVVADLPAVGANLSDHTLGVLVYSAAHPVPPGAGNHFDALAAVRTDPTSTDPDTHILIADIPLPPPGRTASDNGYSIEFSMLQPHSRGSLRLASPNPGAAPLIDPGFLTDERDVTFNLRAFRAARALGQTHAMEAWRGEEVIPGPDVSSDEQLLAYLRHSLGTYFHPAGTCRMGTGPEAVTDTELRVRGVDGLRVVDASVMPSLPTANPNATVLAIAEKAAELIRAGT
ncbi:MAG TPA: GMC family oxidoreductase N-terminal domain-containing protein [Mycobacterium sp.]|nr:GMC family oxidoreductase N-terminal domain-containing protein [Mycobacterium sp.]